MKIRWLVLALVLGGGTCGVGRAFDTIKTGKGTFPGRIVGMNATDVDFEQASGGTLSKQIPVNQIQAIYYDGEPFQLKNAKKLVSNAGYAEALAELRRIKKEPDRKEIRQDIEFYKALCTAKLALGGAGKIADAGRMMKSFIDANPKNYHYFEALEIVGDLLVAIRQYPQAMGYYARLDKAPWPDYKMRAGVATGRALLKQGNSEEAIAAFDNVIGDLAEGPLVETQRTRAVLGKASALNASKKPDEAIKIVEDVLKKTDPENAPLMAQAYNVLGTAQRQAGHTKEALLAFLRVDVLYPAIPEAHAEALSNLVDLWGQVHQTERANQARSILEKQYKESSWAKKGGE